MMIQLTDEKDPEVNDRLAEAPAAADFAAVVSEQWEHERPDLDFSWGLALGRIWRISAMAQAEREARARKYGCSAGDMTALVTLRRSGHPFRLRPEDLRQACVVTSGAITGRIQRLAVLGFVVRQEIAGDRRSYHVRLTDRGLAVADAFVTRNAQEACFAQAYAALPAAARPELDRLLALLAGELERRCAPQRDPEDCANDR